MSLDDLLQENFLLTKISEKPFASANPAICANFYVFDTHNFDKQTNLNESLAALAGLAIANLPNLIRELMEDGLSLEDAKEIAEGAPPVYTTQEWLVLTKDLESLIHQFCDLSSIPDETKATMLQYVRKQSLSNIPASLKWFKHEVGKLHAKTKPDIVTPIKYPNFVGRLIARGEA